MIRELIDLLWRDHPDAPGGGSRGPRAKVSTSQAVDAAIALADAEGLDAVSVRRVSAELGISAMALYTHVGSRDDLLVLMADTVRGRQPRGPYASTAWQARVRGLAEADLALYAAHWWLLDVDDQRTSLGPGTIAKYDHELHAFQGSGLNEVDQDAALGFVADFVRASARARRPDPRAADMAEVWSSWSRRLAAYLGDDFPLAQRVGAAAGEAMNAPYSAEAAWAFGLDRVLDALDSLIRDRGGPPPAR
ncbi:TetR family transcriptional regulator [Murinocardiopsis flavida]|uniref:TetR family transcriptional regulator n=1 Tax=Murinocardiopsis flavida TaxID=645275 RepID=A0A2P8CWT8_9ACTN|nr:TetR/AcrR family transcriptional regulator [Murinocardiopsis flavida]PSK89444.1 TetR family transcriptional regulator [Murinocardiopsis flavida]